MGSEMENYMYQNTGYIGGFNHYNSDRYRSRRRYNSSGWYFCCCPGDNMEPVGVNVMMPIST